jgi:hypothetical protein
MLQNKILYEYILIKWQIGPIDGGWYSILKRKKNNEKGKWKRKKKKEREWEGDSNILTHRFLLHTHGNTHGIEEYKEIAV